jgi:hypothetical protein
MFQNRQTELVEISKSGETWHRASLGPRRSLRWARLLDSAETALYWLIPAITLAYLVFRILPFLGSK